MSLRKVLSIADAWDAGHLAGSQAAYTKLKEVERKINILIEQAARRGEYESLVLARQILRGLK